MEEKQNKENKLKQKPKAKKIEKQESKELTKEEQKGRCLYESISITIYRSGL